MAASVLWTRLTLSCPALSCPALPCPALHVSTHRIDANTNSSRFESISESICAGPSVSVNASLPALECTVYFAESCQCHRTRACSTNVGSQSYAELVNVAYLHTQQLNKCLFGQGALRIELDSQVFL